MRVQGTAPLTKSWMHAQATAGLAAILTDSGYIGRDDEAALGSVLDQAAAADLEAIAVLPLHISWLGEGLKTLVSEVNAHMVPVALVLEHPRDPLGTRWAVSGLTNFLRRAQVQVSCCQPMSPASGPGVRRAVVGSGGTVRPAPPVPRQQRRLAPIADGKRPDTAAAFGRLGREDRRGVGADLHERRLGPGHLDLLLLGLPRPHLGLDGHSRRDRGQRAYLRNPG